MALGKPSNATILRRSVAYPGSDNVHTSIFAIVESMAKIGAFLVEPEITLKYLEICVVHGQVSGFKVLKSHRRGAMN